MIAWEVVLTGLAFALIGALLALRLAEVFSGNDAAMPEEREETARSTPSSDDGSRPGSVPDEDRVVELLSTNGGRLRQQTVVDRTDWSKSKVSRLLSRMEEHGTIRKVPTGRENVIELAGREDAKRPADGDDG